MSARPAAIPDASRPTEAPGHATDWVRVVSLVHASRALDDIEETRLVPERKVLYQFSARGHDLAQILLGLQLTDAHDGVSVYYRSRPLMLALGVSLEDAAAGPLARSGSFSDGRDIGVVFNLPGHAGPTVLPACGGVGTQYTPAAGWAQAIRYRHEALRDASYARSIAVVLGGDASCATNGFWSALTIATTLKLPMLFYIEDNGFGISVSSQLQTPGGNIAANLRSFAGLTILEGDGCDPSAAAELTRRAVARVREERAPLLLRLTVPRLSGHSGQDTQAYKSAQILKEERARDPLTHLHEFLVPAVMAESEWTRLAGEARHEVDQAIDRALARPQPDPQQLTRHVFSESSDGAHSLQQQGGLAPEGHVFAASRLTAQPEATRINMLTAIRRTLDVELAANPRMLVFGEDVGPKGGVHGATLGLQDKYGVERVFDTSLSEEGIIGRAVGMALAGLLPVAEIQFRKYADPAAEQLNDCGTLRWRTRNRFAAPIVVRMPGGFGKDVGDPWHSLSAEVQWAHAYGWQVAYPSNSADAVGLLHAAMRGRNPTIFFEHRSLLMTSDGSARYPGDDYVVPFGRGVTVREGTDITVVTWGAMLHRVRPAAERFETRVEVIDLRSIAPWDRQRVLDSVRKTGRCLIVHEDNITAGFGAEIAATVAKEAFWNLDAPVDRLAVEDVPMPYNPILLDAVLPDSDRIQTRISELLLA